MNKIRKGTYPNNIATEMKKHGKSQETVAFGVNFTRSTLLSLLDGRRRLSASQARKFAQVIGCDEQDLFVQETPSQEVVQPVHQASWDFAIDEIEQLSELVDRELGFLKSTGRAIAAGKLQIIANKLQVKRNTTVVKPQAKRGWVDTKPSRPKQTVIHELSRPWTENDLADALSALRGGMSNSDVARLTSRPLKDIISTKVLFGWLWMRNQPAEPSTADILKQLPRIKDSTRRILLGTVTA